MTIARMMILVLIAATTAANASSVRIFGLSADEWARPRGGDMIPELEAVRAAVSYWGRGSDSIRACKLALTAADKAVPQTPASANANINE